MYLSLRRLRIRHPRLPADPHEAARVLDDAGFAVTQIRSLREILEAVVVGRVESLQPHPNADRLKICRVSDGGEAPLQIITGADNVEAGVCYPLIRSGTTLPNGVKIKKSKLRGEPSAGMLGSARELDLGDEAAGLMPLPGSPAPGTPLPELLPVEGWVLVTEGDDGEDEVAAALEERAR